MECGASARPAASNLSVSWGDLCKHMLPPEVGCWLNEERTSPRAGLFTVVGYHGEAALPSEMLATHIAQNFGN